METPAEWPFEIQESYDPIRILGKGGFASVVLAREKTNENPSGPYGGRKNAVAIKMVGGIHETGIHLTAADIKQQRDRAVLYARREIEILNQVHHPNIVRLFHHWIEEDSDENDNKKKNETKRHPKQDLTAAVLVLEYAKGPTVESLLKYGGALSTTFGRIVIAQAMDAIAYLHTRGVLHRDIKPDNMLVTGAYSTNDSIWDNEKDTDNDSLDGGHRPEPNWKALRSKYKVTLIDFGFARALTPNDVAKPSIETTQNDSNLASYHRIYNDDAYKETGGGDNDELGSSQRSIKSSKIRRQISKGILDSSVHRLLNKSNHSQRDELSRSASHKLRRTMSALGNRNFAAPEIVNKVRPQFRPRIEPRLDRPDQAIKEPTPTTETISNYVADYGLLVDSYSMGHTIRYMMTGVQPGISIEDAIRQQQSGMCIKNLFSLCLGSSSTKNQGGDGKQKRSVRYRSMEELRGEICRLIGAMTQISERNRISIRKARWNVPWIADVLESQIKNPPTTAPSGPQTRQNNNEKKEDAQDQFDSSFDRISYLPFATGTTAKPILRESDHTAATVACMDASGSGSDRTLVDPDPTESALSF